MNAAHKAKPWDAHAEQLIQEFDAKDSLEQKIWRRYARRKYRLDNSEGILKKVYVVSNHLFAYAVAGQFEDEIAQKFEIATGIPKKKAQDFNTFFSSLDHIAIIYTGLTLAQKSGELSDIIVNTGEKSLYFTVPFAAFNIGWNIYRLANRDEKARPGLGYGSLATHAAIYMKRTTSFLPTMIDNYGFRAQKEGCDTWYAGLKTVKEDATESGKQIFRDFSKVAATLTGFLIGKKIY